MLSQPPLLIPIPLNLSKDKYLISIYHYTWNTHAFLIILSSYIYNTIQYNNHLVKHSLIETPLRERPYSSLAASLNKKRKFSKYIVLTSNLETKFLINPNQVGKLLQRAQSSAGIWRMQVKCWDVLDRLSSISSISLQHPHVRSAMHVFYFIFLTILEF